MALVIIPERFAMRRGTAAALASLNEVPLRGELVVEIDTGRFKCGTGSTAWNDLPYAGAGYADLDGLADGDVLVWDDTAELWVPGFRVPEAPIDGNEYVRKDAAWAVATGGGGGGGSGALEHVATVNVSGSAVSSMGVGSLDLAIDGSYMAICAVNNALGSFQSIRMFYNSDTTNTNYYRQSAGWVNTATAAARANDASIMECDASADVMTIIWISKDGDGRARAVSQSSRGAPAGIVLQNFAHVWNTTNNVTSIDLTSSGANAIGVGSYVRVYKVLP